MVLKFTKESPSAMAIDWLSGNLYFVDDSRKLIEVYNIHGKFRKVVIWQKLGEPRNIALHPAKGLVNLTSYLENILYLYCDKKANINEGSVTDIIDICLVLFINIMHIHIYVKYLLFKLACDQPALVTALYQSNFC